MTVILTSNFGRFQNYMYKEFLTNKTKILILLLYIKHYEHYKLRNNINQLFRVISIFFHWITQIIEYQSIKEWVILALFSLEIEIVDNKFESVRTTNFALDDYFLSWANNELHASIAISHIAENPLAS